MDAKIETHIKVIEKNGYPTSKPQEFEDECNALLKQGYELLSIRNEYFQADGVWVYGAIFQMKQEGK